MNINSVESFIKVCSGIEKNRKSYIHSKDNDFEVSPSKEDKLNTEEIGKFATMALGIIKEEQSLSFNEKAKVYRRLGIALKSYKKRLNKSKKWYQKIGSLFCCCMSNEEKKIRSSIRTSNNEKARLNQRINKLANALTVTKNLLEKQDKTPGNYLRHFYLGILDRSSYTNASLEGGNQDAALHWYISHLKTFQTAMNNELDKQDLQSITQLIEELEYTREASLIMQRLFQTDKSPVKPGMVANFIENALEIPLVNIEYLKEAYLLDVRSRIKNLQVGQKVILPGGYSRMDQEKKTYTGHAVMYVINRGPKDTYTFEIVNTGGGSVFHSPIKDEFVNFGKGLWGLFSGNEVIQRNTVKDIHFENISFETLSTQFFQDLMDFSIPGKTASMDEVIDYIKGAFVNHSQSNDGREHKAQKKGSCSHKCVSATIHKYLPELVYRKFKTWMTIQEIEKITQLELDETIGFNAETKKTFLEEGQKVLEHRKTKMPSLDKLY